jgi:multidrug resistance protein MdtO
VFSGSEATDAYLPSALEQEEGKEGFFRNDASKNGAYLSFAMRGCLAATICYFTYEMLDWRGLATSVTTCVVTALSSAGTSRQKQVLRIAGAVTGGFILGIGSQVLILPNIDSIDQFALLFVAVTAIGAWCATASQRLSYFGIQLCLAFYLINLQEFTIQTSVAIARDRVLGIMLGLFVMWLVFDAFGTDSTAAQMVRSFTANLRAIAELALLSGGDHPAQAINRIRALRDQIGANFQDVTAQADAVPFELGKKRKEGMMDRALIHSWNPQVRTLYLMEAALLQHRVFGADADLSPTFLMALDRFNQASAALLRQMADCLDGHTVDFNVDFEASLAQMSHTRRDSAPDSIEYITSHEVEKLSHHVRDELEALSQEIAANPIMIHKSRRCI